MTTSSTLINLQAMLSALNISQRVSLKQSNDMVAELRDKTSIGRYEELDVSEAQWNAIANLALHLFAPAQDTDETARLRARILQLEADHEEGAGTILDLSEQLRESREHAASAIDLVSSIRFALGDNGRRRMQDELVEHCKAIVAKRQPLTDEQIKAATSVELDALLDHIYEYGTTSEGVDRLVLKLSRAIERAHGINP